MNRNIIVLEKLYENKMDAYRKKEKALDDWDYDNEWLDTMNRSCNNGRNMDLYNYYIIEKMSYDIINERYNIKYKELLKEILGVIPTDCIEYLIKYMM